MDLAMAKQLLSTCIKHELRDHAFGDCEVEWYDGSTPIASGYFSGSIREVGFNAGDSFKDDEADELRNCFASQKTERNDETGPDEFEIGKVMPGLTKEGVYKELTSGDDH